MSQLPAYFLLVFVAHLQQLALEYYFSYSKILVRRVTKGRELGENIDVRIIGDVEWFKTFKGLKVV
jgi:hypothetical protein